MNEYGKVGKVKKINRLIHIIFNLAIDNAKLKILNKVVHIKLGTDFRD